MQFLLVLKQLTGTRSACTWHQKQQNAKEVAAGKKLTFGQVIDICKSSEGTSQEMKTMAEKPKEVLAFDSTSKGKFNKTPFKRHEKPETGKCRYCGGKEILHREC